MKTPFLLSGQSVDRVKVAIPTPKEHDAVGVCGRSVHDIARREFPLEIAGHGVESVNIAVADAEINRPSAQYRTRQVDVEWISDGLGFRLHPVQPLRFE